MKVEVGLRVHRLAVVNAAATFLLLFIGGLVTSKGAGLAVPDWPTTFGYNMFLYPWSEMIGDIFYEHGHRLVASVVGLLTILLAFSLWFYERRRWLRWLGALALALVIVQGVIGGLRVVLLEEALAILHACLAQAFFALTVSLALFTSQEWVGEPRKIELADTGRPFDRLRAVHSTLLRTVSESRTVRELEPLQRLCVLTTAMIYLQGVLGAVVRFTGAGIHLHLLFAALVALHVALLAARILRFHHNQAKLFRPAVLLGGLLILQLVLGLGSYLVKFTSIGTLLPALPVVILRTTHVVSGALMLVTGLLLTLRSYRLLAHPHPLLGRQLLSEQIPA